MTNENTEEVDDFKVNTKKFYVELLTDFISLRSLVEDGKDVPAYRNIQKISDKIKTKLGEI
jgi:hypothetical protein